ncbi:MAG: hypothetical protein LBC59_04560 [Chitinispirillales bacterium]|jgi:predicted transposase YdaD|nr:hypothetical protein [Chitinispirillales bacterium]
MNKGARSEAGTKKGLKTRSHANRKYKDGVFRMIFKDKDRFRELYNAIKGTNYGAGTEMQETTLSDVLYMKQKNDVSYLIDGKLVVFMEHQSTINKNIALRMLIYAGRTYERLFDVEKIYGPQKITIPRPEFYVLYNGKARVPEKQEVLLSELFEGQGEEYPFSLDLSVTIYNINIGNNPELLKRSTTLTQYERFIECVRGFESEHELDTAISLAIDECVKVGVLSDFLRTNGSEVMNMLTSEVNETKLRKLWVEYGREEGMEEGLEKGMEKERKRIVSLIEQGVSLDDIKKILSKEETPKKKRP